MRSRWNSWSPQVWEKRSGAAKRRKRTARPCSATCSATAAPKPPIRLCSSRVASTPPVAIAASIVAVSSGFTVGMLTTRHASAARRQEIRDPHGRRQHVAGREQRDVASLAQHQARPDRERHRAGMHRRLARPPEPEVRGAAVARERVHGGDGLGGVAGADDRHVGQRAHDRDVLERVMGRTVRTVAVAAAHPHHRDVGLVVADVVPDLLVAAQRRERHDRVDEGLLALEREAGRDPRHRGLGDADVHEASRIAGGEVVEELEAEIAGQEHDALVGGRRVGERTDEGVPHDTGLTRRRALMTTRSRRARARDRRRSGAGSATRGRLP